MIPDEIKKHLDVIIHETKILHDLVDVNGYSHTPITMLEDAILQSIYRFHKEEFPQNENNLYEKIAYTKEIKGSSIHEKA